MEEATSLRMPGIHHITAICGDPQRNLDFYTGLLGPDGLSLQLVARSGGALRAPWREGPVPPAHAIRGFAGATLCLNGYEHTARLLTEMMGFQEIGQEGSRFRFQVGAGGDAAMIDLHCQPEGKPGRKLPPSRPRRWEQS